MGRKRSERGLTDECHVLSVVKLARDGVFKKEPGKVWTSIWKNEKGMTTSSIGFSVQADSQGQLVLQLKYDWSDTTTKTRLPTEYPVKITTTPDNFGGLHYWFICPLATEGRPCKKRVGRLYLPAGGRYFGCRICYKLMYRSQREYDRRISALKSLPSIALLNDLEGHLRAVNAILRALEKPSKKRNKSLREQVKRRPDGLGVLNIDQIARDMGYTGRARKEYADSLRRRIFANVMKEHPFKP